MRAHRTKFDCSKPFRIVASRTAFDSLRPTDTLYPATDHSDHHSAAVREDIVVPRIDIVPRLTERRPNAAVPLNYIHIPAALCLPRPETYELSEVDWLFLAGLRERFGSVKELVNEEFLQRVIVELEGRAGRDSTLPRSKGWIVSFLERHYPQLAEMPAASDFTTLLYNYWRSRREELRFPLWRPLWKPADNEFNHMLAFKAREKRSRNLRRTNRLDETDLIQELYEECHNATLVCERIQIREELKLRSIHLQIMAFTQECKPFLEPPREFDSTDPREKARMARRVTEDYKRRRESLEAQSDGPYREMPNTRESISCFLANVVYEAERLGICHDQIFPQQEVQQSALRLAVAQTNQMIEEQSQAEEKALDREETTLFALRRHNDLLVRSLSSDEENAEGAVGNYLQAKRRRVEQCYFGDDDQLGEQRDLRRTTGLSFKRFLQNGQPKNGE